MDYLKKLCNKKAEENNTICLNAYAIGIEESKAPQMLEMLKHISEQMEIAWRRYDNEEDYDLGQIFDDIDLEGLDNLIKEATEL